MGSKREGQRWRLYKKKLQELQTALLNINNAKTEETPKEEKQDLTPVLFSEIKAIQERFTVCEVSFIFD